MKKAPFFLTISLILCLVFSGVSLKRHESTVSVVTANASTEVLASTQVPQPTPPVVKKISRPNPPPPATPPPAPQPKKITPPVVPSPAPAPCTTGSFNDQFLCLLNNYRESKNLNRLSFESGLNAAASSHSTWMNANKTMSHVGLDGSTFTQRCVQFQTSCDGENVAYGYTTAEKLFTAWKNSSGHNANMLGSHTVMGLSLVGIYATLDLR